MSGFNDWYAQNPVGSPERSMVDTSNYKSWLKTEGQYSSQMRKHIRGEVHMFARQQFPKSFAHGGFAATVFSRSAGDTLKNPWRKKARVGSPEYIRNLEKLDELHPGNKRIQDALHSARNPKTGVKAVMGRAAGEILGGVAGVAFTGYAVYQAEGHRDKVQTAISGVAGEVGFAIGTGLSGGNMLIGMASSFAATGLAEAGMSVTNKMVDAERAKRKYGWGAHTAPFQTERAHTMRQQSLQLMNRGQMSARSMMGQEAVFVHK